jgi:hypothetical protein
MPWLKYADAALAITAIGAIIRSGWRMDPVQAFLWALPFLGLMFILVEFRRYAEGKQPSQVVRFLIWCFAILAIAAVSLQVARNFWPRLFLPPPTTAQTSDRSDGPTTAAQASDDQIDGPTLVECPTHGNNDGVYCTIYSAKLSSGTKFKVTGTVTILQDTCDPEWRDGNLSLYCDNQESDHQDFIIPRERGKGVPMWQPPSTGDGTNFSLKCSARPRQSTTVRLIAHPRGCSNMRVTNTKIYSIIE